MSVLTVPTANAEDELPPLTIRDVLPNPRALARQALPRVAEATLIPLVLFYAAITAPRFILFRSAWISPMTIRVKKRTGAFLIRRKWLSFAPWEWKQRI